MSPASENTRRLLSFFFLRRAGRLADQLFKLVTLLFALAIAGLVVLMIVEMIRDSTLSLEKFGASFIWREVWDPVREEFGALPFIYGSAVSSIIGLIIAVPVSIGVSVFLVEHAPRSLSTPVSFLVQLLAAIPSVVYGLWGIFVLAPMLRDTLYTRIQ